MPQDLVGYVELEWACPNCGVVNPGTHKTCSACGGAMAQAQQFAVPEQARLLGEKEAAVVAEAQPDIHCGFCGTRNPATATRCSQCGGELAAGMARQAGRVLGAFGAKPIQSTPPPTGAAPVKRKLPLGCVAGLALAAVAVVALVLLNARTSEAIGTVQGVQWERSIAILEQRPVESEAWRDQLPTGAALGACSPKERRMQDQPAPGAEKVCGTPYVVDKGTGAGKVVQDCRYRVYDDYCKYTIPEWQVVNKAVARGTDLNPVWPAPSLSAAQRSGDRTESYRVTFAADDKNYTYGVKDAIALGQFAVGSKWALKINGLGGVTEVSAAR